MPKSGPAAFAGGLESPIAEKGYETTRERPQWNCLVDLLPAGSETAAVFNVMKATLGAGILSLPFTMLSAGLALGLILLTVMAGLSVLSVGLIVRVVHKSGRDTYEEVVDLLFGRGWGFLYQLAMFVFCFGTSAVYIVTIYDIVSPVTIHAFGKDPEVWYAIVLTNRMYFSVLITVIVLLPVSLMKTINSIRYLTLTGSLCACFLAITSLYVVIRYGAATTFTSDMLWKPLNVSSLVSAFNTYLFAFANQPNIPEIFTELSTPTPRTMRKVTLISIFSVLLLYAVEGCPFLVAYGTNTKSNILISLGDRLNEGDLVVAVAFLMTAVTVVSSFPLNIYPVRITILHSLRPERNKTVIGMVVSTLTVGLALCVAIILPDVNIILGVVGAMAGSVICFLTPAALNMKLDRGDVFVRDRIYYCFMITIGLVAFLMGTCIAILDALKFYRQRTL
ncbi:10 transmembrane domain, possible aa transporter, putative [Perkinsus marinus ATCC 50983]|uniref:10 transmembrane domain, possible aa transporter, putative n=1 Tax=Perkinsus marinus (strain ATCC 50983 / TXsc) TaxID=423536 RepID=C5LP27_PERM5|nr:10 transmembrane domain, possible aa transporter, putative [Perkinsus marinus ATCC 50983]EER01508.1 10 transmembrane domain, possible aa transporter, putative [Perkinsus marinus ATCC 50983]|eukprot:XP_002768790.1 10 transmembrane domain, possible aa transporter, putative [Perkinsus marinus ATCC 50983]